jgi:hypothetical protein
LRHAAHDRADLRRGLIEGGLARHRARKRGHERRHEDSKACYPRREAMAVSTGAHALMITLKCVCRR